MVLLFWCTWCSYDPKSIIEQTLKQNDIIIATNWLPKSDWNVMKHRHVYGKCGRTLSMSKSHVQSVWTAVNKLLVSHLPVNVFYLHENSPMNTTIQQTHQHMTINGSNFIFIALQMNTNGITFTVNLLSATSDVLVCLQWFHYHYRLKMLPLEL